MEVRVLLHAEDEVSGGRYLLLEGTDAKVRLIYHTQEIEEAQRAGKLAVDIFVRLERRFADRTPHIKISDYGDAYALLANQAFMHKQSDTLLRQGMAMDEDLWVAGSDSTTKHFASRLNRMLFPIKERRAQSSGRQR